MKQLGSLLLTPDFRFAARWSDCTLLHESSNTIVQLLGTSGHDRTGDAFAPPWRERVEPK